MKITSFYCSAVLLVTLSAPKVCSCIIVKNVSGFVGGGNITVYSFLYPESFDICLISKIGDADLYLSNNLHLPTYEPNSYILHSATCGVDIVHVHKRLKRPIYVSVYGHPSYDITEYHLNVISRESSEEDDINFELLDVEQSSSEFFDNTSLRENSDREPSHSKEVYENDRSAESKEHSDPSALFWFLMNTMIEILF